MKVNTAIRGMRRISRIISMRPSDMFQSKKSSQTSKITRMKDVMMIWEEVYLMMMENIFSEIFQRMNTLSKSGILMKIHIILDI